jgi:two-component system osmolarity sensor histidine kinase EnvZ
MTRFATGWEKPARKFLPRSLLGRSLLGRSLLIIVVPLIATQAVALMIFYGSHLNLISRRLSGAVAGEIAQTIRLLPQADAAGERAWLLRGAQRDFDLRMRIDQGARLAPAARSNILGPMDDGLADALA